MMSSEFSHENGGLQFFTRKSWKANFIPKMVGGKFSSENL